MSILSLKKLGDPVLREKSKQVDIGDEGLKDLVKTMEQLMRESQGVGLAANQIGVLKRVFVYDIGDGLRILLNPQIVSKEGIIEEEEGCLSAPQIRVKVQRAEKIRVTAQDLEGNPVDLEVEGLVARVFQHEIDHLEGKLIIDRCSKEEKRRALREMEGI